METADKIRSKSTYCIDPDLLHSQFIEAIMDDILCSIPLYIIIKVILLVYVSLHALFTSCEYQSIEQFHAIKSTYPVQAVFLTWYLSPVFEGANLVHKHLVRPMVLSKEARKHHREGSTDDAAKEDKKEVKKEK